MQLTLSTPPFTKPFVASQPAPQPARPRDATALSQLDQIAARSLRASHQGLGGTAMFLALIGGLVILGSASMWSAGDEQLRKPTAVVAEARQAPAAEMAVTQAPVVAAAPQAAAAVTVVEPAAPAMPEPVLAAAAVAEPAAAADDEARKARAVKAAEVRRKAAQLAQERALAEETQRLQLAQQREADRAQQQLAEQTRQRAAAEQARLAAAPSAADTRRNVGELCAAGGFIGQQFCRARECGKAEHHGDAICVRLRDDEAVRRRASAER